jgi:hypothetical protein
VKQYAIVLVGLALTLAACSTGGAQTNDSAPGNPTIPGRQPSGVVSNVRITKVRPFMKDGRVQAFVQGEVGDGCTSLQSVKQQRTGSTIDISVTAVRRGEICTMIMQYLNEWVPLDGVNAPGEYTVRANTVATPFRLVRATGGALRVEPDPGPVPQPPYLPGPDVNGPKRPSSPSAEPPPVGE